MEDHKKFASETITPPSPEEIAIANEMIEKAWKLAEELEPCSAEQIWAEFDTIRATIANRVSKPSK